MAALDREAVRCSVRPTDAMLAKRLPSDGGWIVVPYWFACCVLMSTRGIGVTIHRRGSL